MQLALDDADNLGCRRRVEGLQHMLNMYYDAVESVPQTELELLKPILEDLESSLDAGFHVLNWNSLGIGDFTQQCRKAINEFNTRIGQVLKNKRDIESLVHAIAYTQLLPEDDPASVPTLQVRITCEAVL
jgi:dynein heavy chain, axonemal